MTVINWRAVTRNRGREMMIMMMGKKKKGYEREAMENARP